MPISCPMSGWFCLIPLAMFAVMIVLFIVFARRGRCFWWATAPEVGSGETPIDIIKRRYAKGELSREQFEQMKQELKG